MFDVCACPLSWPGAVMTRRIIVCVIHVTVIHQLSRFAFASLALFLFSGEFPTSYNKWRGISTYVPVTRMPV